MKKHLANGTFYSYQPEFFHLPPRQSSEPPSATSLRPHFTFELSSPLSEDDAYQFFEVKGKQPKTDSNAMRLSLSTQPTPRQLLDPKGFEKTQKWEESGISRAIAKPNSVYASTHGDQHPKGKPDVNNTGLHKRDFDDYQGQGMGGLIERIHNVSQREERPPKRQKSEVFEAEDTEKKPTFIGGGKGGEIGEYMRQKKKEGLEESGAVSSIVDLTGGMFAYEQHYLGSGLTIIPGDDEEEIVLVSDSNEKEVCYGRLEGTKVHAHQLPCPNGKAVFLSKAQWPSMKLQLRRYPGKDSIIRVIDPQGKDFGNVDVRTSLALAKIMDSKNPKFRPQARLTARNRKNDEYPSKECSEYLDMTVNLYGPKSKAQVVGKFLSQKNLWLRPPFMVDANTEILNPHAPVVAVSRTSNSGAHLANAGPGSGYVTRTVEEVRSDVIGMFDSLQQSENLPEADTDRRVTTELLSHQKQGLYFLTEKEKGRVFSEVEENNNSLWRLKLHDNGRRSYYNVITGKEERTKPPEVLGGILADMMGLGKTLSILALVVGSLQESKDWASQSCSEMDGEKPLIRNSKATLLVSPLSTVANWEDQIATHIEPKTLNYYVYHGGNRVRDIDELAKYDVIITTYSIVSSEFMGRGNKKRDLNPLLQTNFFRIVLDEAHMIREQSTRQSQAICALSAQRRWAVTGKSSRQQGSFLYHVSI